MAAEAIALSPAKDVERRGGRFRALSDEPWLRLEIEAERFSGRWIELVYDLGLSDRVTRPILRFATLSGAEEAFLPAACLGRGVWRGRVPANCRAMDISPVDWPGPFAFRIVDLRSLSAAEVIALGARKPKWLAFALQNLAVGDAAIADRCVRRALSTPLARQAEWARVRRRSAESFDEVEEGGGRVRVRVLAVASPFSERLGDRLAGLDAEDWIILAHRGISWAPEAASAFAAEASRRPLDLIYADETLADGLRLKPDWSPVLAHGLDYIGKAWAARVGWARAAMAEWPVERLIEGPPPLDGATRVGHVRRPLAITRRGPPPQPRPPAPTVALSASATLVIPTRNRVELLRRCIESLRRWPAGAEFDLVVVDNGSTDPRTLDYLESLAEDARVRVLAAPGEFNFSGLCNRGAALSSAEALVFLNNDTEARSAGWLGALTQWTALPSVGAVGATLLFPDGRAQHRGVVLGIDGHANHFERFSWPQDPGYFFRGAVAHEVSAVTGACLAVERAKFIAVGGFDAVNFPVEFSDIDLCLRLGERGWISLMAPDSVLIHHEAASRKVWRSQERRYAAQVAAFKTRWRRILRDDPYFHPALSLDWHGAELG